MFAVYIFALLIHVALSSTPCTDGVEIVSTETHNPEDLIGNWTYVYHWDSLNKFKREFIDDETTADHAFQCPEISIAAITPDYAKAKETECSSSQVPFNWADAKLVMDAPLMNMKAGILVMGEKENWLMSECKKMVRVVLMKVSEDYTVMVNPDVAHISEMISKRIPTVDELKCVARNVDVGKGMSGIGFCR